MPIDLNSATPQQLQAHGAKQGESAVYHSNRGCGNATLKGRTVHYITDQQCENTKLELLDWAENILGSRDLALELSSGLFSTDNKDNVTGNQTAKFASRVGDLQQKSLHLAKARSRPDIPVPEHRHQVMVGMGQAAVGPMGQMQFFTESLQSCYAVCVYNEHTHVGGMSHIPGHGASEAMASADLNNAQEMDDAKATMNDETRQALKEMMELVQPTEVATIMGKDAAVQHQDSRNAWSSSNRRAAINQDTTAHAIVRDIAKELELAQPRVHTFNSTSGEAVITEGQGGGMSIVGTDRVHAEATNMLTDDLTDDVSAVGWSTMPIERAKGGFVQNNSKMLGDKPDFTLRPVSSQPHQPAPNHTAMASPMPSSPMMMHGHFGVPMSTSQPTSYGYAAAGFQQSAPWDAPLPAEPKANDGIPELPPEDPDEELYNI